MQESDSTDTACLLSLHTPILLPGVCYRLWGQQDEADMLPSTPPEIVSADLAPLALQLASWGCPDGQGLSWLDPPEPQALGQARDLLLDLCAVDDKGSLTDTGRGGRGRGGGCARQCSQCIQYSAGCCFELIEL